MTINSGSFNKIDHLILPISKLDGGVTTDGIIKVRTESFFEAMRQKVMDWMLYNQCWGPSFQNSMEGQVTTTTEDGFTVVTETLGVYQSEDSVGSKTWFPKGKITQEVRMKLSDTDLDLKCSFEFRAF